jgi:DNA-binding Lrp family transcriptional regulator
MDGWWNEIEREILDWLERQGELTPAALGERLGMSEASAVSLLAMLASEGKVTISRVTPRSAAPRVSVFGVGKRKPSPRARGTLPVSAT